jgi:hypothetical protein
LRKAEEIRRVTGVTVPLPDERGPVTDALMASMMLRHNKPGQLMLDLNISDSTRAMDACWRDTMENEKKSRARFAQNAMKPQEVAPEWEKARAFLGSPEDAKLFVERAMARFGVPLEPKKNLLLAHAHGLDAGLRERLEQRDLKGTIRLALTEPAPTGCALLTRTHPLTATLAESLVEASLDPEALTGLGIGRVGAWETAAVPRLTRVTLLRIRYKLTIHARRERLLLAEEAALVAFHGNEIVAIDSEAREMLHAEATSNLAEAAQERFIAKAKEVLPSLLAGPLAAFVRKRADELVQDHARLRIAAGSASRVSVEPVLPPDVIGLFVLMPKAL